MECEVEKIIDSDYSVNENRKLKFHIKWKGFAEKDNSWEPLENLRNCPNKIAEFLVELRQTDGVGMEAILQQIGCKNQIAVCKVIHIFHNTR